MSFLTLREYNGEILRFTQNDKEKDPSLRSG